MTRRTITTALVTILAGCFGGFGGPGDSGGGNGDGDNPALARATQRGDLRLTSPAFGDGERIPDRYGRGERDVNPPLEIEGVPDDADSLALVVDDSDAVEPAGRIWVHWLVWNVPPETTTIPEDWEAAGAVEGENDFGGVGYGGPSPPDAEHTYRFKAYALDAVFDLEAGASADDLGAAMDGHVTAQTQLTGTYPP
ncbi:YbhB/YbcL family Raf kinase inhibitor-like protein [Natronosalvus rutilus]|uniref:YbhB/YbcL family Raf kinase inhibitor-like protein n=1 Tax=Natronosalvus rutilus TaxID=2953753 RepID=UPI003CCCABCE